MLHIRNIKKNLRKLARNRVLYVRPISGSTKPASLGGTLPLTQRVGGLQSPKLQAASPGGPRPHARTRLQAAGSMQTTSCRQQATSVQATSNRPQGHKLQARVGGSRPQARAPRSLHKVLCSKDRGPSAGS